MFGFWKKNKSSDSCNGSSHAMACSCGGPTGTPCLGLSRHGAPCACYDIGEVKCRAEERFDAAKHSHEYLYHTLENLKLASTYKGLNPRERAMYEQALGNLSKAKQSLGGKILFDLATDIFNGNKSPESIIRSCELAFIEAMPEAVPSDSAVKAHQEQQDMDACIEAANGLPPIDDPILFTANAVLSRISREEYDPVSMMAYQILKGCVHSLPADRLKKALDEIIEDFSSTKVISVCRGALLQQKTEAERIALAVKYGAEEPNSLGIMMTDKHDHEHDIDGENTDGATYQEIQSNGVTLTLKIDRDTRLFSLNDMQDIVDYACAVLDLSKDKIVVGDTVRLKSGGPLWQ